MAASTAGTLSKSMFKSCRNHGGVKQCLPRHRQCVSPELARSSSNAATPSLAIQPAVDSNTRDVFATSFFAVAPAASVPPPTQAPVPAPALLLVYWLILVWLHHHRHFCRRKLRHRLLRPDHQCQHLLRQKQLRHQRRRHRTIFTEAATWKAWQWLRCGPLSLSKGKQPTGLLWHIFIF